MLPDYSVVHKQDWFIKERYKPELQKDDMRFLSRSFARHFNERPYLKHTCYLYLTKTTKAVSYTHLVCPYRGQSVGMGFVQVLVYPLAVDAVAP